VADRRGRPRRGAFGGQTGGLERSRISVHPQSRIRDQAPRLRLTARTKLGRLEADPAGSRWTVKTMGPWMGRTYEHSMGDAATPRSTYSGPVLGTHKSVT